MFECRTRAAGLDYQPADYEEACLRERNWLALLLQMQECRRACAHGIEAHVVVIMCMIASATCATELGGFTQLAYVNFAPPYPIEHLELPPPPVFPVRVLGLSSILGFEWVNWDCSPRKRCSL
jgi:hypothetical protein